MKRKTLLTSFTITAPSGLATSKINVHDGFLACQVAIDCSSHPVVLGD
ncbi:hypothetical protein [Vibrio cincinnatiensis]|jgi:hypothetical protein|nr:hypothetical protein [Vibrio cincinnatiensis]